MDNKAKSQVNSWSIALILTQLGAKRAVQSGLGYPELRLTSCSNSKIYNTVIDDFKQQE